MSASIFWIPVSSAKRRLDVWQSSNFVESMRRAFGESPWKLDGRHLPILRGMAATHHGDEKEGNPYTDLIRAIEGADGDDPKVIEVWPEY